MLPAHKDYSSAGFQGIRKYHRSFGSATIISVLTEAVSRLNYVMVAAQVAG
jgi:hypothetical protein